jgi:predicted O-linked N-acetylglucosamine transferase (SPINDLY family)
MVTFEGPFMRGRQSAAMLKRLGLPELVAASADDYLRIARALAHEPGWRSQVRAHLAGQAGTLFDQPGAIASLQAFLLDLAHG